MRHSYGTASSDRALVTAAMKAPMLSKTEELRLTLAWRHKQDKKSLDRLINSYLRLVISAANRYRHYGLAVSDIIQEGTVGLMEAASRFDPERDVRFSTYANWWIRASIQDFVLRNWSIVRTGTTAAHKSLFFNLKRLKAKIVKGAEGAFTQGDRLTIAREMNVKIQDVETMEGRLSGVDRSLNAPVAEDSFQEWQEILVCHSPLPEQTVMMERDTAKRQKLIQQALASLNSREQYIIRQRKLTEADITLAALGSELGISKERVRQLEANALKKIRQSLETQVGDLDDYSLINT